LYRQGGVSGLADQLIQPPNLNLDFFLPAGQDSMHLVKYLEEEK